MLKSNIRKGSPLTLGILGGGQLAKMLASAVYRMGLNVAVIENHAQSPAGDMTKLDFSSGWEATSELDAFIEASDIITLENEFIDPNILEYIEKRRTVYPSSATMRLVQDKLIQKQTFQSAGLPVPNFVQLDSLEQAISFGESNGFPFVVKARKYGYDGYGNATVFDKESLIEAWTRFHNDKVSRPLMAESFVDFTKELAVIVARNYNGHKEVYPCVETVQYRHICHEVIAPAEISESIMKKAQQIALQSVESIDGIGVFGVEMFLTTSGELLLNEIAPRPHNSGHYTIEACQTSQFENCIRAVCNLPLGSAKLIVPAACMVNLLGQIDGEGTPDDVRELLGHTNIWLHLYNKKKSRIGRKMGHITAVGNTQTEAIGRARSASNAITW
ncbi:MAG: 5-(carboxyamino)imidazole ribonucleotide synthase [Ignavibacteriae bacterium HGW-Ignavibacteriae-1]|jgi:5-(carboxyamino)imidazole ribonucleotide synthase|nr:MAG: 5-(carboxyamino)imidazole ribonucleotide synthase [Ignavibacteriae bacterium HGW-Ignavibacteriae-1]